MPTVTTADPRAAFLAEFEKPAAALLDHYSAVQTRDVVRQPAGAGRTRLTTATSVFDREHCRVDGRIVTTGTDGSPTGSEYRAVEVRNRVYRFDALPAEAGGYSVGRFALHADQPDPWSPLLFPVADPWLRHTYLELFRDPATTVHATRREVWRGKSVVTVEIECRSDAVRPSRQVRAVYYFDPAAGWACVGDWAVPINPSTDPRYESVYHYVMRDGWPVPTRLEMWELPPGVTTGGKLAKYTDIEEYLPISPLDERDFRLTAFGLPEPAGVVWPKPRSGWWWFVWAAVGCVVVAIVFLSLRRRAVRRQVAPPASRS
ncbi:MAG: hypothetical protein U0804_16580 [Gemmataceae bacterium]